MINSYDFPILKIEYGVFCCDKKLTGCVFAYWPALLSFKEDWRFFWVLEYKVTFEEPSVWHFRQFIEFRVEFKDRLDYTQGIIYAQNQEIDDTKQGMEKARQMIQQLEREIEML